MDQQHSERSERPVWLGEDLRQWDHIRVHVALLRDDRIGANEIAAYAGLAVHAELHSGTCWPALETVAGYMDVHPRTARRSLTILRDTGWIDIVERAGKASIYRLRPPPTVNPHPGQKVQGSLSTPGTESAGHPGQKLPGTPDTVRDEQEPMNQNQEPHRTNRTAVDCDRCKDEAGDNTGWILHGDVAEPCGCDYRAPRAFDTYHHPDASSG